MSEEVLEKLGDLIASLTPETIMKLNHYLSYFYNLTIEINKP